MTSGTAGSLEESRAPGSHAASSRGLPEIEEEGLQPRILESATLAALVALPQKKLLCVAAPPYHNCVAFAEAATAAWTATQ